MKKRFSPLKLGLVLSALGICFLIKPCPHGEDGSHTCWIHPNSNAAKPMGSALFMPAHSPLDSVSIIQQTTNE